MTNNKISFAVENVEMIDSNKDSNFAILSLDFFASGENLHDLYVSENTLMRTANTIKNCPIVWAYDEKLDDVYTHTPDEVPCGFVPETSTITSRPLEDGRTMLSVVAYVWKRYTGELLNFFKRDGGKKPVSVEMIVYNTRALPNDKIELTDFRYEGITILGSLVTPAIPLAQARVLSFSELKRDYMEDLESEFPKKYIELSTGTLVTFPYKSISEMNPALKGITPPITLAQANSIAAQADAIGTDGKANGWAVAIASFKKTHVVKDGKWVKKTQAMAKESENMSEQIMQETLGLSEPEKEEKTMEEEKMSEVEMAEAKEEEKVEELSASETEVVEESMAIDEEKDKEEEDKEDEEFKAKAKEDEEDEEEKSFEESLSADKDAIIAEMSAKIEEMAATIEKMTEDSKVYMAENEELKKFKSNIEESQKSFAVEQTIRELEEKVIIPEEQKAEMIADAEKYSFSEIEEWKTLCKAKSFDFVARESDESNVIVKKAALPFGDITAKSKNDLWQ